MRVRIDTSGNLLIDPDTATTSSKYVTLYLIAAAILAGETVSYKTGSPITDVAYDPDTHVLTWEEQGQSGTQSVTLDNNQVINLLGLIKTQHDSSLDSAAILQRIGDGVVELKAAIEAIELPNNEGPDLGPLTALCTATHSLVTSVADTVMTPKARPSVKES